jgi:competence protein ComEC
VPWLVVATAGFTFGILCESAAGGSLLGWWSVTGVSFVIACFGVARARPWAAGLLFVTVSMGAGGLASALQRARVFHSDWPTSPDTVVEGVLTRPLSETASAVHAVVDVDGVIAGDTVQGVSARVLVTAPRPAPKILPGDRVRVSGVILAPRGAAHEGAFDGGRFLIGRGMDGTLRARAPGLAKVATTPTWSPWRAAALLQDEAQAHLSQGARGDGVALLGALVVGSRGALRPSVEDAFRKTGTSHVLSVSGLHLFAVAFLFYQFVRWAWLRSGRLAVRFPAARAAALVAIPVAIAYTLVTGAEVATVRALLCTIVTLGGCALGRRPDGTTALAIAALVVLGHSPWVLLEPSFQLSFSASLALLTLGRRWGRTAPGTSRRRRALAWAWRLLAASLAATLATAPWTALHFGVVQPAGVLMNLLVVPATELLLLPLGLIGVGLSFIWAALGHGLIGLTSWLASLLIDVVSVLAEASPVLEVSPPSVVELVAYTVALVALGSPLRPRLIVLLCTLSTATIALSAYLTTQVLPELRKEARVTFLDVGQGDSAVIEAPGGETWLVDAGGRLFGTAQDDVSEDERLLHRQDDPGERAVWAFLRARRIRTLDLVVISHPHPDHYGGLLAIASHVTIGELWITGETTADPAWTKLLEALSARGVRVLVPPLGVARARGGARLIVLGPGHELARAEPDQSVNDNSLVVRLELGGRSVLFPGDLEAAGEASLLAHTPAVWLKSDVVKAPHHGSRTSSSPAFVEATAPAHVIMSCGVNNRFRFPAPEVLRRWQERGASVLRTDQDGAVAVTLSPTGRLVVRAFLPRQATAAESRRYLD